MGSYQNTFYIAFVSIFYNIVPLRRYKAKCSKQPKIVNLSFLKTSNDIKMKSVTQCCFTSKVPFLTNKTEK